MANALYRTLCNSPASPFSCSGLWNWKQPNSLFLTHTFKSSDIDTLLQSYSVRFGLVSFLSLCVCIHRMISPGINYWGTSKLLENTKVSWVRLSFYVQRIQISLWDITSRTQPIYQLSLQSGLWLTVSSAGLQRLLKHRSPGTSLAWLHFIPIRVVLYGRRQQLGSAAACPVLCLCPGALQTLLVLLCSYIVQLTWALVYESCCQEGRVGSFENPQKIFLIRFLQDQH